MLAPGEIDQQTKAKIQNLTRLLVATSIDKPPKADMDALNRFLDENPDLWREVSSLAEQVTLNLIEQLSLNSAGLREVRMRECARLCQELGYAEAPTVERLIIKQIIMCWLRLWWTEFYTTHLTTNADYDMKVADHWENRLSQAQKRYMRAVESFARVRKITRSTKAAPILGESQPFSKSTIFEVPEKQAG